MRWRGGSDFGACANGRSRRPPADGARSGDAAGNRGRQGQSFYPFGAVIIGAADHTVLAQGVNNSKTNPVLHGEIAAINDYVARHGNQG